MNVPAASEPPSGTGGRLARFRRSLNHRERVSLGAMATVIVGLHVLGFTILFAAVAPQHFPLGGRHAVYTAGVGVLAYVLGLRHAFDADHIAAIDNTTRKLLADSAQARGVAPPKRPLSVGFYFSLGHSTIVFVLAVLLSLGARAAAGPVENTDSALHSITGFIGASVSGLFLWLIGILNLLVLIGILKIFAGMRAGRYDPTQLDRQLDQRGFLSRILGGLTRAVRKPWHCFGVRMSADAAIQPIQSVSTEWIRAVSVQWSGFVSRQDHENASGLL